jgi:hypothetical protein
MGQVVSWFFFYDTECNSDDDIISTIETDCTESIINENENDDVFENNIANMNMNMQNNILTCQKVLFKEYDNWSRNDEIMNILNDPTNTLIMRLKVLYPEYNDKYIQSIALAFYMNTHQMLST